MNWQLFRLLRLALFLTFLAASVHVVTASVSRIKVDPSTADSLLIILKGSESLHSNLVAEKSDEKKIKTDASQIMQLVKVAIKTAKDKEPAENFLHLEKILLSTESRLQDFLN